MSKIEKLYKVLEKHGVLIDDPEMDEDGLTLDDKLVKDIFEVFNND